MRRSLLAALALALLGLVVLPAAAGASWLQDGSDARRTGSIPYDGPETNDTALEVQFPVHVGGFSGSSPLIHDGDAYLWGWDCEECPGTYDGHAVWRLNLTTGEKERLVEGLNGATTITPSRELALERRIPDRSFTDPHAPDELAAVDLETGEREWSTLVWPDLPHPNRHYWEAVFDDGIAYVGVSALEWADISGDHERVAGVAAVDLETGEVVDEWKRPVTVAGQPLPSSTAGAPNERVPATPAVTVGENHVYAYIRTKSGERTPAAGTEEIRYELWSLEKEGLTYEWNVNGTSTYRTWPTPVEAPGPVESYRPAYLGSSAIAGPQQTYIRLDEVTGLNKGTGDRIWETGAGKADQVQAHGTLSMGLSPEGILVGTSPQTVYGLDASTGQILWQRTLEDLELRHFVGPTVVDSDTAYVISIRTTDDEYAYGMDARDLQTGELKWRWEYSPDQLGFCSHPTFGDGFFVWGGCDGTVHVIGETEASLGEPNVTASTAYPGQGEEVSVDLSGTKPGAFGNATRYKADWGDGTTTGWQEDPVLTHAYSESGDQTARFWVGNDANQTASTTETFHVGEDPPPDPNFAQKAAQTALADGNVDITFGVLGLVMAVTGGAVGVARRRRKRSRLQEELEALKEGYVETKDNPGQCEAFLDARKGRARSLLVDGTLTEEQVNVLENRIDELRREMRTGVLDERFQFLPYGMVQSLKGMLADGEISTWDRSTLESLLEEDEALNEAQRERVRGLLERWSEDAGGGGAG